MVSWLMVLVRIPNLTHIYPRFFQAREDPPLPESYTCQKCEFTHRSRQEFQKHIKKHLKEQEKGDSFQCTECGNCFCSLKSLENHLYMSHKVTNLTPNDSLFMRHFRMYLGWILFLEFSLNRTYGYACNHIFIAPLE